MTSYLQFMTPLLFFRCTANLSQTGSLILDARSTVFNFTLKITTYLTIAENKTKKTQLSYYCFEKWYYFCLKMLTFCQTTVCVSKTRTKCFCIYVLDWQGGQFYRYYHHHKTNPQNLHPQLFRKYLKLTLVFMWNRAPREKVTFCFSKFFC